MYKEMSIEEFKKITSNKKGFTEREIEYIIINGVKFQIQTTRLTANGHKWKVWAKVIGEDRGKMLCTRANTDTMINKVIDFAINW